MSPSVHARRNLLLGAVLGLLALMAGIALAETFLPEWRAGEPPNPEMLRERYREMAARAGFVLEPGEPQTLLVTRGPEQLDSFWSQGDSGIDWLLATRSALRVLVSQEVRDTEGQRSYLGIDFAFNGQPQSLWWSGLSPSPFAPFDSGKAVRLGERLAPLLLAPGEALGARRVATIGAFPRLLYPLVGSRRPQHLAVLMTQGALLDRQAGPVAEGEGADAFVLRSTTVFWRAVPLFLALGGLFVILLLKRRISVLNGVLLAALSLPALWPPPGFSIGPLSYTLVSSVAHAVQIFLLWSCGESLLRSTDPEFTTSLDALRAGRLGPRGGRALLTGFAWGAALAGLRLGLPALTALVPGVWQARSSVSLPLLGPYGSPVPDAILLAGIAMLALAIAVRLVPLRWAPLAAALGAGLFLHPLPIEPRLAGFVLNAGFAGLLIWIVRRNGLTALLTACVVALAFPGAVLAAGYLPWMPGAFTVLAALPAAAVLLGVIGISRSGAPELQRLAPPAFVRRLEEERRFQHEMDLLAKMQRGLLPRTLPRIEGYELAARSIIANEAGGDLYDVLSDGQGYLWLAAGDVAGHGYSCAIAQAMTKAALASLAGRGRTPAEVLHRADRVLRAAGPTRNFTSLTLLRLRPESGEGWLSNAGHPYPLLVADGEVSEIEISALPLGLGPPRRYEDRPLHLPPGGFLVFCSDGLFEASDGSGRIYGFERLRELLREMGDRPADKILEALIEDWRRHLRASQPLDDTTVVVLKRTGEAR
ncbi:MAG TPA: SpoIIE family protein phosphatase [Thermoanaerobaculia bacterium]|nr:SpoIIE family protein phosphatase [Thermoanaerobaculia bacterium]